MWGPCVQGVFTHCLAYSVTSLTENMDKLKKVNQSTTRKIEELGKVGKQQEDKRKANLIFEELKENKKQVTDLFVEIGVNVPTESIGTASRLGLVKANSRHPRHILVCFVSPFWKQEVFQNMSKAKNSPKKVCVHSQDNLHQEVIDQPRDLRCLAALVEEKAHRVSLRGGLLVIDNQRHRHRQTP